MSWLPVMTGTVPAPVIAAGAGVAVSH